jgi:hypothetical protein
MTRFECQVIGQPARIDAGLVVMLPDGREVDVPLALSAEAGRFYFTPTDDGMTALYDALDDVILARRPRGGLAGDGSA